MTRDFAEQLPMIELAEMLIEWSEDYQDDEANDIVDGLDRYDAIEELENCGAFEDDND